MHRPTGVVEKVCEVVGAPLATPALSTCWASTRRRSGTYGGKRTFDLILGVPLAVLATPIIIMLALVSAFAPRTWPFLVWPFLVRTRLGQYGQPFRFVEIRSVPRDCGPQPLKPEATELRGSRFCRLIRGGDLGELPQSLLVVTRRVSLVGPGPKMPDKHELVATACHVLALTRLSPTPTVESASVTVA